MILGVALASAAIGCADDPESDLESSIDTTEPAEHHALPTDAVGQPSLIDDAERAREATPLADPGAFRRDLAVPPRHRMTLPTEIR